MRREYWPCAAVIVSILTSTVCPAADTAIVSQRGRKFTPDILTVAPHATVLIENDDGVTHNVFIDQPDMKFDSGEQAIGKEVAVRFDHEGRFAVRCAIHPTMHLEIIVGQPSPP